MRRRSRHDLGRGHLGRRHLRRNRLGLARRGRRLRNIGGLVGLVGHGGLLGCKRNARRRAAGIPSSQRCSVLVHVLVALVGIRVLALALVLLAGLLALILALLLLALLLFTLLLRRVLVRVVVLLVHGFLSTCARRRPGVAAALEKTLHGGSGLPP